MSFLRPRPEPDPDSRPYWDACRQHRLLLQHCADCDAPRFPPGPVCSNCGSARHLWKEASGKGRVFSWIVVRHPVPAEVFASEVPYVVALVELDEGVRLPSNIIDCAPEDVSANVPVQVTFDDVAPDLTLVKFRLDN
ncbi:MAG: hypothetical protein K0S54_2687 [Alphaproteobacteria bacterium]|jgi:uncharacterized OB-fold protein|nr:hypothetical protein [Alphaproteobacteria bacterium]